MPLIPSSDNIRVSHPPRGVLVVLYSMWRRDTKQPAYRTAFAGGLIQTDKVFRKLQEARDFAKANGYNGIKIKVA